MSGSMRRAVSLCWTLRPPFISFRSLHARAATLGPLSSQGRPDGASILRPATPSCFQISRISTSDKTKVVSAAEKIGTVEKHKTAKEESLEEKDENWISFGYSLVDRDEDEWAHHLLMFFGVTIFLCWGGFILAYLPSTRDRSWAQREAYLELDRRERSGLPLIDADLISQDKIILPSEEELADFEIVI